MLLVGLQACGHGSGGLVTAPVVREPISQSVIETGTTTPQDTILVGSQVSGSIQEIYVDYNSPVRRGQVLARLDPSTFVAALAQARATLAQLEGESAAAAADQSSAADTSAAAVQTAQSQAVQIAANDEAVRKSRSALALALLTQRRDQVLLAQGYVARSTVDNDVSNTAAARAALSAAQSQAASGRLVTRASSDAAAGSAAQVNAAGASTQASADAVLAAQAAVQQAQLNLEHATITSPVDGTVIERNVSVGQTVAAALQAPTLFTIAKDLGKMELDIAAGEPDVGSIHAGQHVAFSVLAYPGRVFTATIAQVRQNPTVVNNVTTYTTVAYADNRAGLLRPGMTANVTIDVATYAQALVVPLAALQWQPSASERSRYDVTIPDVGNGGGPSSTWGRTSTSNASVSVGSVGRVYVLDGNVLRAVAVRNSRHRRHECRRLFG